MAYRVAWLIPEYPRQSHTFFYRELNAILQFGIQPRVFSTRLGSAHSLHPWAAQAVRDTTYLHPPKLSGILNAVKVLIKGGPSAWMRTAHAILEADVASMKARLRLFGLAFYGAQLAGWMLRDGLSHVHVQFCSDSANVAMFAKLLGGVSYSISHHEYLREFGPNQKQKWRHARFGHTISRVHLDELREKLGIAVPHDMVIAPMGIEPENFARRRPYEPWNHNGEFRVFSCGRLSWGKNQLLLIQAIAKLRNDGIPATLTLAGGDESPGKSYLAELQELVSELKLEPYVHILGQTAEDDVIKNLESAHVAALASLHEGVPVVIMEAMAMELPVVATDVGGMRDLVLHTEDGLLVPPGDADAMTNALSQIAHSPILAREMGAAARRKVIKSFNSGVSAAALAAQMARNLEAPSTRPDHASRTSADMSKAS